MPPKKQQEQDVKLVAFHDLHIAMLDFLMKRSGATRGRNEHIRNAVKQYALNHPDWDLKLFLQFAEEKAVKGVPRTGNRRALFLQQAQELSAEPLNELSSEPMLPNFSVDSTKLDY